MEKEEMKMKESMTVRTYVLIFLFVFLAYAWTNNPIKAAAKETMDKMFEQINKNLPSGIFLSGKEMEHFDFMGSRGFRISEVQLNESGTGEKLFALNKITVVRTIDKNNKSFKIDLELSGMNFSNAKKLVAILPNSEKEKKELFKTLEEFEYELREAGYSEGLKNLFFDFFMNVEFNDETKRFDVNKIGFGVRNEGKITFFGSFDLSSPNIEKLIEKQKVPHFFALIQLIMEDIKINRIGFEYEDLGLFDKAIKKAADIQNKKPEELLIEAVKNLKTEKEKEERVLVKKMIHSAERFLAGGKNKKFAFSIEKETSFSISEILKENDFELGF